MATMSTDVWCASQYQQANTIMTASYQQANMMTASLVAGWGCTDVTTTPEPPHDNATIQRLSELWRNLGDHQPSN